MSLAEAPSPADVHPVLGAASAPAAAPAAAHRPMMGGVVAVQATGEATAPQLEATLDRVDAWARRLTRFDPASELRRLNDSRADRVRIGPTVTAVLDWGRAAEGLTSGLVDIAMLEARLAAEGGDAATPPVTASRRWSLDRGPRWSTVRRAGAVAFDLDGVAKGWLADRALAIVPGRSAIVDADGDIALRLRGDDAWALGVADPSEDGAPMLGVLRFHAGQAPERFGVATSGVSVHRWAHREGTAHHLIDPHTWRPAVTDVVQATVIASSAREAEVLAKAAVIAGTERAFALLDRPGVLGALILTERGELRATTETLRWLA